MSEAPNNLKWQPWLPHDLSAFSGAPPSHKEENQAQTEEEEAEFTQQDHLAEQTRQLEILREQAQQEGLKRGYEEGQKKGYDSGFQEGLEAGRQQGNEEVQHQQAEITEHWKALVNDFQQTLDALDSVITSRLMQVALTAAKHMIGHAGVDGTALLEQIQQLIQEEPLFNGKPQLYVHPDDYGQVKQQLGSTLELHGWRLMASDHVRHGGCKVSSEEGELDASLAMRWNELCRLVEPGELE